MENELKPCPFCGGIAEIKTSLFADFVSIICSCGFGQWQSFPRQMSIKRWNTRPKPSVKWPSLKDEVANGDGKGKTDEWSIGWNEAVKVCQAAVRKEK